METLSGCPGDEQVWTWALYALLQISSANGET